MDLYSRALRTLRAVLAGLVALSCIALIAAPAEATDEPTPPPWDTFVIGDSIANLGAPYLRVMRPDWLIFTIGGLSVSTIPELIETILSVNPEPELVVVALGTNADATWTRADFDAALALLPSTTKVALVTTYRDPLVFPPTFPTLGAREYFQPIYSWWMREAAETRPNTCAVNWRALVARNPSLLYDGVHPTGVGRQWWAWMVSSAGTSCT